MTSTNKTREELQAIYEGEYADKFSDDDFGRIERLVPKMKISKDDRVLDVACGNAILLKYIHESVKTYIGIDISQKFIDRAQQLADTLNAPVELEATTVAEYCRRHPESITVATALDFTEHIYDDQFIEDFTEIYKSLRRGGRCYIHTPNAQFIIEILKDKGIMKQFPEHIAVRSWSQYKKLLKQCGFSDISIEYLPHYNRILAPLHILSFIPLIGRFFKARLFITAKK